MRPIVFHLADGHMEAGLRAFFRRDNWHYALDCRRFEIDAESPEDILRVGGCTDCGLWTRCYENLATHLRSHERAIVIIDEYFDPWPGAAKIREDISRQLLESGWQRERFEVVVIQPMLEAWLWVENDRVANAFGFSTFHDLRQMLHGAGLWDEGQLKPNPSKLKDARDLAARRGGRKIGKPIFCGVFEAMSSRAVNSCTEPGFALLRETLRRWFPPGGVEV